MRVDAVSMPVVTTGSWFAIVSVPAVLVTGGDNAKGIGLFVPCREILLPISSPSLSIRAVSSLDVSLLFGTGVLRGGMTRRSGVDWASEIGESASGGGAGGRVRDLKNGGECWMLGIGNALTLPAIPT